MRFPRDWQTDVKLELKTLDRAARVCFLQEVREIIERHDAFIGDVANYAK